LGRGACRFKMQAASIILAWLLGLVLVVSTIKHPEGTDSSRFSDELRALYGEIFVWHESMYIFPGEWTPDPVWQEDITKKADAFLAEMARLPKSACADAARAIVEKQGAFVAYTEESMPAVEKAWKKTLDALPLTCGEF
jgi:hypothetical protein